MSEVKTNLKKGDVCGAFTVLNIFDVKDYHSTAIHLRHKTGMEVLHLLNDEDENLFSFAFRTPNPKGNGAAHILEHSVLCGSERFPLKDPFIRLSNQSVKTYLNAMTYPDRTVFPASSMVKADYFNLMSVYGDAVFFPRLENEIFMQEAHRLELDEQGTPSIQGVVYNEMKGSYSSFESVASDAAERSLLAGSVYEKDSGGDPLEIPTITHDELVAFHDKWYRPDNCFVFLYGNIPTEEQLEFLQRNFLDRLEKKYPHVVSTEETRKSIVNAHLAFVTPKPIPQPVTMHTTGPAGEEETGKNTVLLNWRFGTCPDATTAYEYQVLTGILLNHDGSPLQKALLESGLGEDTAPQTGLDPSQYACLLTVGLRGVKKGDEEQVQKVIFDTLSDLVKKGIPQNDIDSTLMTMEYSQCEIKRVHGPYALRLMTRPIYAWLYGFDVEKSFRLRATFDAVAQKVRTQKGYVEQLIQKLLLDNQERSLVVVSPTKKYTHEREKAEKKLITELMKHTSKDEIKKQNDALHAFQSRTEDDSCMPHIHPKDFLKDGKVVLEKIPTKIESVKGADGKDLPLFTNCENTNGIIYVDVGFPADVVPTEEYPFLPILAESVTEVGWGDLDWAKTAEQTALHTGGISVSLLVSDMSPAQSAKKWASQHPDWVGREWVVYRMGMLEKECATAMRLLADCISLTDFHDTKRLQDIITELRNDVDSTVIPDGHDYVSLRAKRTVSRTKAIDEIWNGLTLLFTLHSLPEKCARDMAEHLKQLFAMVKAGGAFIHVTAEESGIQAVKHELDSFVKTAQLCSLKHPAPATTEDFIKLTEAGAENRDADNEVLLASSQVGFAAQCTQSSPFGTKEAALEEICTHWLSNTLLWEKLRTIGGAYGAFCYTESLTSSLVFSTYRDPTPQKSADVFNACLEEGAALLMDEETVERAVTGTYSSNIQPRSPHSRGATGLLRTLYGIFDEDREEKVKGLLFATPEEVRDSFRRLAAFAKQRAHRSIITGNNADVKSGIVLPV
ncbi:MAG: insulinase family protein [Treponema sp.]|nr:insulinase family protein [Treponema sp.]